MAADDNLTRDEARRRAQLVSGVRYAVSLDLRQPRHDTFASTTVVGFDCAEPGSDTFLDLDAASVVEATLNGERLPDGAFDGRRIALTGLSAVNEVRVVARCAYQRTGVGLHRFVDPVDDAVYVYTQLEPFDAHRVFACFDQPDLKARFSIDVAVPDGWLAVSTGAERDSRAEDGATVVRFVETAPLSCYVIALVAGPYARFTDVHGDLPLGLYCRRSLQPHLDPDELFALTKQGFDFFTEAFDHPYPFGKYDQLFVPEFNAGAMENAACVTFSEAYVFRSRVTRATRRRRAETVLHELAHMWFGNLVTMRWWDDLWLNESFATYGAYLAMTSATEFREGWSDFTLDLKSWAYAQDQLPSTHPVVADIPDTDAVRNNFDGITYAKGASILRQLVAWVGDEAFLEGLREYFRRHAYANAELSDFLGALEKASGRELGRWSESWLQMAGANVLRPRLAFDEAGCYASVAVRQDAPADHPVLREHRIGVGLYDLREGRLALRRRVDLDVDGAETPVPALRGEAVADLLLLNDGDLAYARIRLDERSLATLHSALGTLTDPLPRALCWLAAWDMTRDGELPARRWVALVAEQAGGEDDVGALGKLLRQAQAAIDRYGDPGNRATARQLLAGHAQAALRAAEPGSDVQLVWARAFASVAEHPEQLDTVAALYDGTLDIPGLAVDTDLRWHLLTALAVAGRADAGAITAEAERDPTDQGARRAAGARAARPDPGAKAAAWRSVLEDPLMPLAMMRAIVGGFAQHGQEDLLRPYVERWLDALEHIWAQRSPDVALLLTEGLYPATLLEPATVGVADRALRLPGVPEPGRRLVLESRDATVRALRARAADRD